MVIDLSAIEKFVAEWNQLATFDGHAAALEHACRSDRPAPDTVPKIYSRSWFAGRILDTIEAARQLHRSGRHDAATTRTRRRVRQAD